MKKKIGALVLAMLLGSSVTLVGCDNTKLEGIFASYTIPQIDLDATAMSADIADEYKNLYGYNVVDDSRDYLAHPDSLRLKNGKMVTFYAKGHGKGEIGSKWSDDGVVWNEITGLPQSWNDSKETPTVYELKFNRGTADEYIGYVLISGCPTWGGKEKGNGFNVSVGKFNESTGLIDWTEFTNFYGRDENGRKKKNYIEPVVAMASLTQLKDESGNWTNSWMGFFHDANAYNYKTILTFDSNGNMNWSVPEKYFKKHRAIEKKAFMCEVEVVRSDAGEGNELMLIARSNGKYGSKPMNSLVSISTDEGKTWSEPKQLPAAINGERHKAEWIKDANGNDRLFVTFRSIARDPQKMTISTEVKGKGKGKWYSEGWIAWVGTYDDLKNCREGQYRIKLAHTYLSGQTATGMNANGDCGYCGNVVFGDGYKIMTSTYGRFNASDNKTIIASKVIDIRLVDELVANMTQKIN